MSDPTAEAKPGAPGGDPAAMRLDRIVEEHIRRVLVEVGGNKSRAAEMLGIPRTSLYHKIRKYGLSRPEDGGSG